jgi:hypothetical protein
MAADFTIADKIRKANEGGWANNPNDSGGETAFGWARNFWPKLRIWPLIDEIKKKFLPPPAFGTSQYYSWVKAFNAALRANATLMRYVDESFKSVFWDGNRIGELNNQDVANWLYDHAVNAGGTGIKFAQLAVGVAADGAIGNKTIAALNAADPKELLEKMEDIAACFRLKKGHDKPSQIGFLPSWLERDGVSKEVVAQIMKEARDDGIIDDQELASLTDLIHRTT